MSKICLFLVITAAFVGNAFGQQLTSDSCYRICKNQDILCAAPFHRETAISEQRCLAICSGFYNCISAVFQHSIGQCDLYAVGAMNSGRKKRQTFAFSVIGKPTTIGDPPVSGIGVQRHQGGRQGGKRGHHGSKGNRRWTNQGPDRRWQPPPNSGNSGSGGCTRYSPPSLRQCNGNDYYEWTGNCNRGTQAPTGQTQPVTAATPAPTPAPTTTVITTTTQAPLPDDCPAGQTVRYLRTDEFILSGQDDLVFSASSIQECLSACTNNRDPSSGTQIACKSFDFNTATNRCALSKSAMVPTGNGPPEPSATGQYYEKLCVDANDAQQCDLVYGQFPQKILIGFARSVIDATSYRDCISACLESKARFGFVCRSGMYYFEETSLNCILNFEDRTTQPTLFVDETFDRLNYFETGCRLTARRPVGGTTLVGSSLVLLPKLGEGWGEWSTCDTKTGSKRRFRNCESPNPANCEFEQDKCKPQRLDSTTDTRFTEPSQVIRCSPVLFINGTIDCAQAGYMFVGGSRIRCKVQQCK